MYMKDWIECLGLIMTMNEYTILDHVGKITHAVTYTHLTLPKIRLGGVWMLSCASYDETI